jgi:hypothetical protein
MSSGRRSRPAPRDDRDDEDEPTIRELVAERIPVCEDCGDALVPGEESKHVCDE